MSYNDPIVVFEDFLETNKGSQVEKSLGSTVYRTIAIDVYEKKEPIYI